MWVCSIAASPSTTEPSSVRTHGYSSIGHKLPVLLVVQEPGLGVRRANGDYIIAAAAMVLCLYTRLRFATRLQLPIIPYS